MLGLAEIHQQRNFTALEYCYQAAGIIPQIYGVKEKVEILNKGKEGPKLEDIEMKIQDDADAKLLAGSEEWTDITENLKSIAAHYRLAIIYQNAKSYEKAQDHFKAIIKLNDAFKTAEINERLGDILFKNIKDYKNAIIYYKKAYQTTKTSSYLHIKCGKSMEKLKLHSDAIKEYQIAAALAFAVHLIYLGFKQINK